jgi:hypothetical protein
LNGVLFVDVWSWNVFFLNNCVFREFSGEDFRFSLNVSFLSISDVESGSFSINNRLNDGLLINGSSWNWNRFGSDSSFLLHSFKDGWKFLFSHIGFVNVNFLINSMFSWLNVGVIFNSVSWNGNIFFNFLISLLSRKENRFSVN